MDIIRRELADVGEDVIKDIVDEVRAAIRDEQKRKKLWYRIGTWLSNLRCACKCSCCESDCSKANEEQERIAGHQTGDILVPPIGTIQRAENGEKYLTIPLKKKRKLPPLP